jgi:nucleotide-binding universal stress UspA family protein
MPRVQRIIVGISGSPRSLPALRCAADLARAYEAELVPVHAWIPPLAAFAGYQFPSGHLRRTWEDAAWQWLWQALEMACGGLPPDTLSQPVIAPGNPGLILVRTACRADDLLVIGTGRRDAVIRLWHGEVSRYCLAHARCPVLAIPPDRSVLSGSGLRGLSRRHRRMPGGRGRGPAFASRRTKPHPARRRSTHLPRLSPPLIRQRPPPSAAQPRGGVVSARRADAGWAQRCGTGPAGIRRARSLRSGGHRPGSPGHLISTSSADDVHM